MSKSKYDYYAPVVFKDNTKVYYFGSHDKSFLNGEQVVVETVQGLELGRLSGTVKEISTLKMQIDLKPVLRKASPKDLKNYQENLELSKETKILTEAIVKRLKLDMNILSVDYTLDKSKVLIVYGSDERVDFRELLKELATKLKCRIELRQVGARDQAKRAGGIGVCGMVLCCTRYKTKMEVITINMAKNQLNSLHSSKISGQCGKLLCCLAYENNLYTMAKKNTPKINAIVKYQNKNYKVSSLNYVIKEAKLVSEEETLILPFEEAFKDYHEKYKYTKKLS